MKTMDKAFLVAGLISLSFLIGISSCDDGKSEGDNRPTQQVIESTLKENSWEITNFDDDETHHFSGYSFHFNTDGSVVASKSNSSISGTWSTFNSSNGQLKLNIEFMVADTFEELNDDWVVIESTDTRILLQDRTGRSGEFDKVTLEKVKNS
jgi:hypothetical protein